MTVSGSWLLIGILAAPPGMRASTAAAPDPAAAEGVASALPPQVARTIRKLRATEDAANEEPEVGVPALEEEVAAVADAGIELASHPAVLEARVLAYLTLARGWLVLDRPDRATVALDEAIRLSGGATPPVKEFGPTLARFYEQRRAELDARGTGAIRVRCTVPCRVYVDDRERPEGLAKGLVAGPHRVYVVPAEGKTVDPLDVAVLIDEDHRHVEVPYAPADVPRPERADAMPPAPPPRLLPLWVEGLGVGLGLGGTVAGTTLLALDGRCAGGGDPNSCPRLYEFTAGGAVALAVGAAVLVTSVALLAADASRARKARRATKRTSWVRLDLGPAGPLLRF